MTSKSREEMYDTLSSKGPELLERIDVSERLYSYLASEKVLSDLQIRDLQVSTTLKPITQGAIMTK